MINTLTKPCFELVYSNGEPVDTGDCIPHYPDHTSASEDAPRYQGRGSLTPIYGQIPTPHQLDVACVTISCDECDEPVLAEDYHFFPHEVDAALKDCKWARPGHTLCFVCGEYAAEAGSDDG